MKVIVNIATKGDRPVQLKRVVNCLRKQVEVINIYDNSKAIDYTDNAKFFYLQFQKEPCYYLTCDDDLFYPGNYVEKMIADIERYGCIVSYHGRRFTDGIPDYYNSGHFSVHHWKQLDSPEYLDVAGTGCTGFRTDYLNPLDIYKSEYKCMSDLVFSLEAAKEGKQIISPEKRYDYIQEQSVNNSIYLSESKGDQKDQIYLMNEIKKCKKNYIIR